MTESCQICSETLERKFFPMAEWKTKGPMCGKCYSKKIAEFYPGEHVRVDTSKE